MKSIMSSSSSVVLLQKSNDRSALGFSLWMKKMKGQENQVNMVGVGNMKSFMKGKLDQGEPKKKLCMCSPTNHPGSFKCRYHRSASTQKLKPVQAAAGTRDYLKLKSMNAKTNPLPAGVKPQLPRFSKGPPPPVVSSELPR